MQNSAPQPIYVDMSTTPSYRQSFYGNISDEYLEDKKCQWNALNTCIATLLFFTFMLNVLAAFVLFRVPLTTVRGKSNPVYFCIRVLNICDILQAAFLSIMPAFAKDDCQWIGGQASCNIMGVIALFFLLVSPLITILMAFDRVIALYFPFKYRSQLGLKMLKIILPSSCVFVMFITLLPMVDIGEYHVVKGRRFCLLDTVHLRYNDTNPTAGDPKDRAYAIAVHVIFLIALIFMLSCTAAIQWKLHFMPFSRKPSEITMSQARQKFASRRTRNATSTAVIVCGIFICCYMPYVIRVIYEASTSQKSSSVITWITFGLSFVQSMLNPVVCIVTNTRYRKELQALVKNIKVAETEYSSESGMFSSIHKRTLSFTGFRRNLSSRTSKSSRNSSKRGKQPEPHAGTPRSPVSPRSPISPTSPHPYINSNGSEEQCKFLLEAPKYATLGVTRTKNCDIKSLYAATSSTCPREGFRQFRLFSMSDSGSPKLSNGEGSNQIGKTKM